MNTRYKLLLATIIIGLVVVVFMLSPFFTVTAVTVNGHVLQDEQAIIADAGLTDSTNIFTFSRSRARAAILANPYIDSVNFRRVLPDKLYITVQERFLSGYISHPDGRFLYIDENGRLLEIASYMREHFPVIKGLDFSGIRLGEIIEVTNPESLRSMAIYAQLLNRHQLSGDVATLDVSDINNIRVRVYNVDVHLGTTRDAAEKISTLVQIIEEWPMFREVSAELNLRDIDSQYILRIRN